MIDVEMWFLWCKGVVFGVVLSVIIKEFGEWMRRRRIMSWAAPAQQEGAMKNLDQILATWFFNKIFASLSEQEKRMVRQVSFHIKRAAQQKMHQTAFGVGILCLFIGYVAGWLTFAFKFGGW